MQACAYAIVCMFDMFCQFIFFCLCLWVFCRGGLSHLLVTNHIDVLHFNPTMAHSSSYCLAGLLCSLLQVWSAVFFIVFLDILSVFIQREPWLLNRPCVKVISEIFSICFFMCLRNPTAEWLCCYNVLMCVRIAHFCFQFCVLLVQPYKQ